MSLVEVGVRVKVVIAEDVVKGAVIGIRSRFSNKAFYSARCASELCSRSRHNEFELSDGFNRRSFLIIERRVLRADLVKAVEQNRCTLVLCSANLDLTNTIAAACGCLCARPDSTRLQEDKCFGRAKRTNSTKRERQIGYLFCGDDATDLRRLGLKGRCRRIN